MKCLKNHGGVYMLLFYLSKTSTIKVGGAGTHTFKRGWYIYHGSAHGSGGVLARVSRHARHFADNKKPKWQVDYFREHAKLVEVWFSHDTAEYECKWSLAMSKLALASVPVKKMGASDCRKCPAHFYYLNRRPTTALLRHDFASSQIQVVEFEPRRMPKFKLEWELDYWTGRQILERVRLAYYNSGEAIPANPSLKKGNPELVKLLPERNFARMFEQVKFAYAVDSVIQAHGDSALGVIFNSDKPQSRKAIESIARKSWDRQRERIFQVSEGGERSIGPQRGDVSPDTIDAN